MKARIRFFKIADPIIQSLLFMLFTYAIYSDEPYYVPYKLAFNLLLFWQLISAVAHQYFKRTTKLKKQRKYHLITVSVYLVLYLLISFIIPERIVEDRVSDGTLRIPIYSIGIVAVGLGICFWYSILCFREIKRILKKAHNFE